MTIAIPSLRAITCTPQWVRNDLWRRARAVPSLDLQFADRKSLVDAISGQNLVTFTRASSGTYVGSDGLLKTATTNEPRFDHNPTTGESLGLLVEEQRTNSIRNNTMVGAVAGTPGTLPTNWVDAYPGSPINGIERRVVGTGQENGITYLDYRLLGTATSGTVWNLFTESVGSITAASGQSWTSSFYCKRVAGSDTGINNFNNMVIEYSGAGVILDLSSTSFLTTGTTLAGSRFSVTRAFNNASTASARPLIQIVIANGATIDITLRIGMPQLEQGSFATSVIPTTGSAATRNADLASITGASFSRWYRQDEGSFFARGNTFGATGIGRALVGNQVNYFIYKHAGGAGAVYDGANVLLSSTFPAWPLPSNFSMSYSATSQVMSVNGSTTVSGTSNGFSGSTQLTIGGPRAVGTELNGCIARLTYWPARLSNATLQAITL